jgi:hypothetical protein
MGDRDCQKTSKQYVKGTNSLELTITWPSNGAKNVHTSESDG